MVSQVNQPTTAIFVEADIGIRPAHSRCKTAVPFASLRVTRLGFALDSEPKHLEHSNWKYLNRTALKTKRHHSENVFFTGLFSDSLGLCNEKASLKLMPDARPIFRKNLKLSLLRKKAVQHTATFSDKSTTTWN